MVSFTLRSSFLTIALLVLNTTALPHNPRDNQPQWSFHLYPTSTCAEDSDLQVGTGSTGCRADLNSVASAYQLISVPEGCRVDFFDNTMCDSVGASDVATPLTSTELCRMSGSGTGYGSYQVTCYQ